MTTALGAAQQRDHRRPAEADVVGEGGPGAGDLAGSGLAAQVPGQLGGLGDAGGAQRMALEISPPDGFTTHRPP